MATITSLSFRLNSFYNGEGLAQARRDIQRLDSSMNALDKSSSALVPGMKALVSTVLTLGPALVPIAGGLLGIGAAAGSAMVAAGAAVGIFGLAMKGAIESTVGASSAFGATNTAIKTAEKALAKTTAGTREYDEALKKVTEAQKAHEEAIKAMPPVQQKFARGYDQMTGAISKFNDDNARFTLGPATTFMEAFTLALPKLSTAIAAVSPEIQRVADLTKKWVTDGGLDRFLKFVNTYGVQALHGFIEAVRSLFTALGVGMRDTAPLGAAFTDWLRRVMDAFKQWAEGGGFQRFLEWLQKNKDSLLSAARDLGTFLGNLGQTASNLSGASFTVLGTLLKVLASFPPGVLTAIVYAWLAWNAALTVYNVVAFIAAAATTAMTIAATPLGMLLAGMALTVGAVVLAIIALAVGIYFLVKHWDTVWGAIKKTAQMVWGWLKVAWEVTWNAIKAAALAVWNFLTNGWGQVILGFMGPIGWLILVWKHWDTIWGAIKGVAMDVWDWLKGAWSATVGWFMTAWESVVAPIRQSWNTVWPELKQAAENVWNVLKAAWELLWSVMKFHWDIFWNAFGPAFTAAWDGATATAKSSWDFLTAAWGFVWSVIQGTFKVAWAVLSGAWSVGWTFLTEVAKVAWAALTGAWKIVWSVVTGIWNTFYATFSGIFSAAWNTIVAIVTGIWNVIKAGWSAFWKTITAIFMGFLAIFTGNWSGAWNALKDAAAGVWNVIKTAWQAFLNVIRTALDGFINTIKASWSAFWGAIQNTAQTFWNVLRALFQASLTAVQNLWNTVWTTVRNIFQTITSAVTAIAQAWWAAFRAGLNVFLTFISNLWNTTWAAIRTFFQGAINNLIAAATGLWASVRQIFSAGSTWLLKTFWDPVNQLFTKTIPNAFEQGVKLLGAAWEKLKKVVRDPVQAIVTVVYNNGIVRLWNAVATVFGAKKLDNFTLPAFKEGGPTGNGSANGFPAVVHPGEHVWTKDEVRGAGGHGAVAALRSQAMGGAKVRVMGDDHAFADGGGILGTGIGPDAGPDLVPDGIIKDIGGAIGGAIGKLKDLALGTISGPFGAAVDAVAKAGKSAVRAAVPGSGLAMEQLGVGMVDKIAETVKSWVTQNDVAPAVGGNGFVPWKAWQPGDGTHQGYGGVTVNRRTAAMLNNASKLAKTTLQMFQGSYSNSVGASAGTHSGGGAVDVGPARDSIVGAMRASGFAAWRRTAAEGFSPHIHGIAVGDPTVSAAAAQQVKDFQAGLNGLANRGPDTYTGGTATKGSAQATAKAMLSQYGWGADQWGALQDLWNRESGWSVTAKNPSSGAYGIPQALPASKMKSAGADYLTNATTQIKWGLGYIKSRYGTPGAANAFQRSHNWYALGTPGAGRGPAVVGEHGPEVMNLRGGERIDPLTDLVGRGGDIHVTAPIAINGRADHGVVDRLERETIPKLTMAIKQGVGRRP